MSAALDLRIILIMTVSVDLTLVRNPLRVHARKHKRQSGGGSFFLACEDFARMFPHSFPVCALFFFLLPFLSFFFFFFLK